MNISLPWKFLCMTTGQRHNEQSLIIILGGGMPKAPQRTYGFTVQRNIRILSAPPETTIEFDRVVTNHGGMWDRTSNMFISPVKGLYMFYLYVFRSNTGVYLDAYIVKDGVKLAVAHISNAYPHGDSSVSLVVELEPLDRVYCRLSQGILLSHVGSSIGHVHFSGFLISVIP